MDKRQKLINDFLEKNETPIFLIIGEMQRMDMSQRDLSKVTGISESNLSKILSGKRPIKLKLALVLGAALNIEPTRLIVFDKKIRDLLVVVQKKAAKFAA